VHHVLLQVEQRDEIYAGTLSQLRGERRGCGQLLKYVPRPRGLVRAAAFPVLRCSFNEQDDSDPDGQHQEKHEQHTTRRRKSGDDRGWFAAADRAVRTRLECLRSHGRRCGAGRHRRGTEQNRHGDCRRRGRRGRRLGWRTRRRALPQDRLDVPVIDIAENDGVAAVHGELGPNEAAPHQHQRHEHTEQVDQHWHDGAAPRPLRVDMADGN
jgi:hypothetical protein